MIYLSPISNPTASSTGTTPKILCASHTFSLLQCCIARQSTIIFWKMYYFLMASLLPFLPLYRLFHLSKTSLKYFKNHKNQIKVKNPLMSSHVTCNKIQLLELAYLFLADLLIFSLYIFSYWSHSSHTGLGSGP